MSVNGILIDVEWCTGCHTCETACQMEKHLPVGQYGIKLSQIGPYEYEPKKWQYFNVPSISLQCDLCSDRVSQGKQPICVKHCQAACMTYGTIDDLVEEMKRKPYSVLLRGN